MDAGTATFRTILDKPLNQLTEDDISQLTREDCRKFLKEKGMRRPSWNKSQAIQQVISLKALLEPQDDDGNGLCPPRKLPFVSTHESTPENLNSSGSLKIPPRVDAPVSLPAPSREPGLQRRDDPPKSPSSGVKVKHSDAHTNDNAFSPSPRICETSGVVGQMTIFYSGKVNVYDDVPVDKARAIMSIAASPMHLAQDNLFGRSTTICPPPCHLQWAGDKDAPVSFDSKFSQVPWAEKITEHPLQYMEKGSTARDSDVDGQASRKVSLQRYLEKRKDRGRLKSKKVAGMTSFSLQTYLNHQVRFQASNGNSSPSSTSSPPQPRLLHASCSTAENQLKIPLSVDLNDKSVQKHQI